MNFGLFLFKNNIINLPTLLDAVQSQYESLPSLIKIFREELKVDDQTLLDIITSQDSSGISLLEAVKANSDIGDDVLKNAIAIQNQKIKTIGEILIDNNLVDIKVIQEQVDAYLKPSESAEEATSSDSSVPASSPEADEPEVSQAAIDSMKEIFGEDSEEVKELQAKLHSVTIEPIGKTPTPTEEPTKTKTEADSESDFFSATHDLDADFVSELILKFNAREIVDLSKAIKGLPESPDKVEALNTIKKKFHTILGAAKLSGAKIMAKSIQTVEAYLDVLDPNTLVASDMEKLYQFFSLLVKLRNHIEQEKSEKGFFQESNRQEMYENLKDKII